MAYLLASIVCYYKIAIHAPIWPYGNYFALTGVSMLNKEVELTQ